MKSIAKRILIPFLVALFITGQTYASSPVYTGESENKAIKGYDAVSYFIGSGQPVKGSQDFQTSWRGADWHFSSQKNLTTFIADPEKYAPQYGGYCAWAAAHGGLAKGDPNVYHLENGKIYLNYDESIKKGWMPRKNELISLADKKYPTLVTIK